MTVMLQQLIALSPLLIVGLTMVIVMLCISWQRNHFINATLTIVGLNLALLSLWLVTQNGPIDVTPLLRVDKFSVFYTGLTLIASLATSMLAYTWLVGYPGHKEEFYLLILISEIGGILLTSANHLASLFLGIELISLPLFGMVSYAFCQKYSLEAGIKYTLLSAISSSFLLFGMALIYAQIGQLSFVAIGQMLGDTMLMQPLLLSGFGMMLVGLCFKLSLVPFHLWTPDVYQGAPAPVSVLIATTSKIVIFAAVMRLFLYVPLTHSNAVRLVLAIIAFASMLFGNLMALSQENIKRMLGYSSITHFGYMLVGLIVVHDHIDHILALEAIGVYFTGYLFANLGVFGVISLMSSPYAGDEDVNLLYSYRGLFWHKPLLSFVLTVMILSLAGIPITLGFIGKFYVITLGMNSHLYWLIITVIVSSVIGLFYYLRIIINLYLSLPKNLYHDVPYNHDALYNRVLTSNRVVMLISSILTLFLGLYPQPLITLVQWAQPIL